MIARAVGVFVIFSLLGFYTPTVNAQNSILEFEVRLEGIINGDPLVASGVQTVSMENGNFTSKVELSPPKNFHPLATGCAIAAMNPGVLLLAQTSLPFKPLIDIVEEFREVRRMTIQDSKGSVLGDLIINSHGRIEGNRNIATVVIHGTYTGPTDLVFPGSYDIILTQSEKGQTSGQYTQTVMTSELTPIFIISRTRYSYEDDKTISSVRLMNVRFNTFSFKKGERALTEVTGNIAFKDLD